MGDMKKVALICMMLAHCKMKYYVIQTSNNKKIARHQPVLDKGIDKNHKFAMAGKEMEGMNKSRIDDKVSASGGTDEFGSEYSAGLDYYYYDDYQLPRPAGAICAPASSAHKKFRCRREHQCIDISKLCDGNSDCNDGTDESPKRCNSAIEARIRDKSHGGGNFHLHYSGLLEVKFKGVWGTVCLSGITKKVADVFCHMLGFVQAEEWKTGDHVRYEPEQGAWPVWINNKKKGYDCSGEESSITECHDTEYWYYDFTCDHPQDVYLTCDKKRCESLARQQVGQAGNPNPCSKTPGQGG